jgi:hypothetical protein
MATNAKAKEKADARKGGAVNVEQTAPKDEAASVEQGASVEAGKQQQRRPSHFIEPGR